MKKWISLIISVLTVGVLVACGDVRPEEMTEVSAISGENVEMSSESSDSSASVTDESVVNEESFASEEKEKEITAEIVKEDGHEKAFEAVDKMLLGWNLGNSFDATGDWILKYTDGTNADFETAWGNPVTPDTLMAKIKKLGFEAVRIPVTWRYHFDEEGNIDEAWMARVQEVVDQALAADLYCIINIHHDTGANGWLRTKMMTKGVPLIIGEFATDDKDNTEDRIKWYTHVIEKANEQNITCFIWDNGNGFCMGHIDREGDADDFPEIIEACVKAAK